MWGQSVGCLDLARSSVGRADFQLFGGSVVGRSLATLGRWSCVSSESRVGSICLHVGGLVGRVALSGGVRPVGLVASSSFGRVGLCQIDLLIGSGQSAGQVRGNKPKTSEELTGRLSVGTH